MRPQKLNKVLPSITRRYILNYLKEELSEDPYIVWEAILGKGRVVAPHIKTFRKAQDEEEDLDEYLQ